MIQKTPEYQNKNRVNLFKSQAPGHKIIGTSVSKADSNSTTISRKPIIEIDEGIIPDPVDLNTARDALIAQAKAGNLTQAEIETLISMIFRYRARHYEPGDFFYDDETETVYEVKQEHQSTDTMIPASRPDLYEPLVSLDALAVN
jgi:hypothetical protein